MTTSDATMAELLAASLREVLSAHPDGRGLGSALDELGWAEVVADDTATATTLLFTEHGRALATSRLLDDIVLAELAASLPEPTGGRAVLYAHPPHSLLLGPLSEVSELVTISPQGQVTIVAADAISTRQVHGFDPDSGWLLTNEPEAAREVQAGQAGLRAVAAARRALAAEIIGCCAATLAIAIAHTSSRVQYGHPIGTFQAVRHRLAECHVAIEAAGSSLAAAWADGGTWAAGLAKHRAGYAQAEVMRHAVQVFGAMGLSQEGPMHRYVARAASLDMLLGGHRLLAEEIGAALLAGADLQPVAEI